ncbi:MAG: phospholipase [Halomonadaceae bacterium]|nr:MAG: phospholipase [Halomonadaceae bacterium]
MPSMTCSLPRLVRHCLVLLLTLAFTAFAHGDTMEEAGEELEENNSRTTLGGAASERGQDLFSYSGTFVPHRRMYIMPFTWLHNPNQSPQSPAFGRNQIEQELANEEIKFQLSFKLPLLTGLFDGDTELWLGYTQVSLWQAYNNSESRPFRETNYEPELFLTHDLNKTIGPGTLDYVGLSFNHQSNGRPDPRSRSWNRIIGEAVYSSSKWAFSVRPWYRIPESSSNDDNPDISRFLGYAEYNALYQTGNDHTFGLRGYNNLRSGGNNRTSGEFSWSFPLGGTLRGYVQYYNGYGETLIDYNHRVNRVSLGFLLNDWF